MQFYGLVINLIDLYIQWDRDMKFVVVFYVYLDGLVFNLMLLEWFAIFLLFRIQLFLVFTKIMIPVIEKKDCLIKKLFESDYRECHACRVSV